MSSMKNVLAVVVACVSFTACSTTPKNANGSLKGYISSRSSGSFQLQPYKELTLDNGLKIIFVKDESLPRVSLTMLLKVGASQEPTELAGLNSITAGLLEQGTQTRDALKIADEFGAMGSSLDVSSGYDVTTVYADSLTTSADTLLDLFSDVVINPAFKDGEIFRLKSQYQASYKKKIDNPSGFADDKMDEFLFGTHPYSRDASGTPSGMRALTKQDIIKHYLTFYRPNNSILAVVGKFDEAYETQVENVFAKWTKRSIPETEVAEVPNVEGLKVKLYVKKGLKQTQIRIGQLGINRLDPDFLSLRLANESLGGSFGSRLNQHVRDDLGLTYSIYSGFDVRKMRGSFEVSTFTKNETAGKTLDETLKVIAEFANTGATNNEVIAAKSQLVGQFPRAIETADRMAYNLATLDFYGVSKNYLTEYVHNINKITSSDVNSAFKRHVNPNNLKVVVYGDAGIVAQFKKYNPEIVELK